MNDNKKFWDKTAGIYERFNSGGELATKAYVQLGDEVAAHLNKEMTVLELAAGPGMISKTIAQSCQSLQVTDFSEEMVEQAKRKGLPPNVSFSVADATQLEFEDNTFDAVVIANALHIMPDPVRAVREINRVLKADGILIAPTFTRENMKTRWKEKLMEVFGFKTFRRWTHHSYQQFLQEQGMILCYKTVITGHNFPISFVVCKKKETKKSV